MLPEQGLSLTWNYAVKTIVIFNTELVIEKKMRIEKILVMFSAVIRFFDTGFEFCRPLVKVKQIFTRDGNFSSLMDHFSPVSSVIYVLRIRKIVSESDLFA